jgi:hypothetical protein
MNLRLVIPQRKGYAGSSTFTDAEVADLPKHPTEFFKKAGTILAHFLQYLVTETQVCKPTEDGT